MVGMRKTFLGRFDKKERFDNNKSIFKSSAQRSVPQLTTLLLKGMIEGVVCLPGHRYVLK
jgi:hypothetical protein